MQDKKRGLSGKDIVTVDGVSLTVREWSRIDPGMGLTVGLILARIRNGWSPEEAVVTPPNKRRRKPKTRDTSVWKNNDVFATGEEEVWVFVHRTSRSGEYVKKTIRKNVKDGGVDKKE